MKGAKPTPSALKVMRGTDQPVRMNENEISVPQVTKLPAPPAWFGKMARRIYKTKGTELINQNVLGTLDLDMFVLYCNEYAAYIETSEELNKVPNNAAMSESSEKVYRRLTIKNQRAWERCKAIAIEFGFTPSARSRVNAIGKKETMSEFEKLMNG